MNGQDQRAMNGMNGMSALVALGLGAVLAASGCVVEGAKGGCPALDSCGGNPVGTWTKVLDACQFQPVRPAQPVDTMAFTAAPTPAIAMIAPPQPNPVLSQQTTSGDWCSNLVYVTETPVDAVLNVVLWHDAPTLTNQSLANLSIAFGDDHTYLMTGLTFTTANLPPERNTTHFAPRCLLASGAGSPTCTKLTAALKNFYGMTATPLASPNFSNIDCQGDALTTGCDCSYIYSVTISDGGNWSVKDDNTLLEDSSTGAFTYNLGAVNAQSPATTIATTFCAQGGTLQLTGPRGGSLFGVQGLRTLMLSQ
jgi:hypothetical protein